MSKFIRLFLISFVACFVACADPMFETPHSQSSDQLDAAAQMGMPDPTTAPLPDQYTVRVQVTARTDEARDAAFQTGLRQVYMQLTGHANLDDYPPLKEAIAHASDWVEQYQYQQSGEHSFMLIHYNPTEVNGALKEVDLSAYVEPAPGASHNSAGLKEIWLVITDVNDLDAYLRVDAYLNTLPGVDNVQTSELSIPNVTFQFTFADSVDRLEQLLDQGNFLSHADEDDDTTPPITLYYRYNSP